MKPPIRVVLADDHPVVRRGIRGFLERAEDIQVVGEASTGGETLILVHKLVPDVLLLDMELPDMNGVEVAQQLQQSGSSLKILVLSAYNNPHYVDELVEIGAWGYLLKEEAPQLIVEAVRGVAQGEKGWFSESIAAHMIYWVRGDEERVNLTSREMEVLHLLTEGKTNQNIAALLGVREKTVEKHMSGIFQKLGVSSRTEAAVYAIRERFF